jgi:hypothetical protein
MARQLVAYNGDGRREREDDEANRHIDAGDGSNHCNRHQGEGREQ